MAVITVLVFIASGSCLDANCAPRPLSRSSHPISLSEKLLGPNRANGIQDLNGQALALRKLGNSGKAAKLEQRTQSILAAQSSPN
jgi:hypothetical protein